MVKKKEPQRQRRAPLSEDQRAKVREQARERQSRRRAEATAADRERKVGKD